MVTLVVLLAVMPMAAFAQVPPINAANNGTLTQIMQAFFNVFNAGFAALNPIATRLLFLLAGIEFVLAALYWSLEGQNLLPKLFQKILILTFIVVLVTGWPIPPAGGGFGNWAKLIANTFTAWGSQAGGGGGIPTLTNPSAIIDQFWRISQPISDYIDGLNWWNVGALMMLGFAFILLAIALFIMAVQCALTYLEFYLIAVLATVLIPFAVNKHTSFLAERAIGAIFASAIKMGVLAFILAAALPVLQAIAPPAAGAITVGMAFNLVGATFLLAILAWNAPGMAAGLMGGSPSLHAGHITGAGTSTAFMLGRMLGRGGGAGGGGPAGVGMLGRMRAAAGSIGRGGVAVARGTAGTIGATVGAARTGAARAAGGNISSALRIQGAARGVASAAGTAAVGGVRRVASAAVAPAVRATQALHTSYRAGRRFGSGAA